MVNAIANNNSCYTNANACCCAKVGQRFEDNHVTGLLTEHSGLQRNNVSGFYKRRLELTDPLESVITSHYVKPNEQKIQLWDCVKN